MSDPVPVRTESPPWWDHPRLWLAVLVVSFFSISLYAGIISYLDFQLSNSTDAGVITQAVASTAHGGVPPFFESWDCLYKGRCSFLVVHPAFLLYAEVPAFYFAPSTITLFAIRAAIIAVAALPLYWLTRQLTGSPWWALLAAGAYLAWAPTSSDDFSLHMEAFLPLEILLLVALWQAGRYRLGLATAAVTFATIEVGPVFTFLVGAFFLVPPVAGLLLGAARRLRTNSPEPSTLRTELRRGWSSVRVGLGRPSIRYCLVLMGASVAAYVFLFSFMNVWGSQVLGIPAPTAGTGLAGLFYDSSSPSVVSIGTVLTSGASLSTAEYWLLLYALLAFVPLLSLRALILSVPWIGWTFLTASSRFTTLGHQYSLIAAGPLFVGFAYGLQMLVRGPLAARSAPERTHAAPSRGRPRPRATRRVIAFVSLFVVVVLVNVLFLPYDPVLPALGYAAGQPLEGNYFDHSITVIPGFADVQRMLTIVPANATLAAPSVLYALIAARPGAIVLKARQTGQTNLLPFNDTAGPDFALLNTGAPGVSPVLSLKAWGNLSNPSDYGLRAYVASTGAGTVLLYERHYSGAAELFGPALPMPSYSWTPGRGLSAGPYGVAVTNSSSPSGSMIETAPGANRTGLVWDGASGILAPENYSIRVTMSLVGVVGSVSPGTVVMDIGGAGFGGRIPDYNVTASQLPQGAWVSLTYNVTLTNPLPTFALTGIQKSEAVTLATAFVQIEALGPP